MVLQTPRQCQVCLHVPVLHLNRCSLRRWLLHTRQPVRGLACYTLLRCAVRRAHHAAVTISARAASACSRMVSAASVLLTLRCRGAACVQGQTSRHTLSA